MTCVVGAVTRGRVALGSDAAIIDGDDLHYSDDPKIWRSGPALLGASGDWLYLDLLRRIDVPSTADDKWFRYGLTAALRKLFGEVGKTEDHEPDGEAVIGAAGALYYLTGGSLIRSGLDYVACGSGATVALGALCAAPRSKRAVDRCRIALAAAERHCAGIKGPFTVLAV